MKVCSLCGTSNADVNKFCQHCGRPLTVSTPTQALVSDATVRWSGQPTPGQGMRAAIPVEILFAKKNRLIIGRSPDCDVCLPHASVSRRHALLERLPDGLRLTDLGSVNGVSVDGRRLSEPTRLLEHERIGIGPFLFTLIGGVVHSQDNSQSLRLEARHLEKVVPTARGQVRKLLDDINLTVEPGEFISLLGPSGSGKSTLMDCLNGRRPATGGRVLANGEDFYRHFDSFRQSLGYVPQRDIVHTQLTVYRALYYTAQLRLPTDTDPAELAARIEEVVKEMELEPHRDTLVANLSGGQIKRVSLGAELLARPCLLYIDEATSGLDAGTEARMMRLFRRLADEGKSVICITHNVDNVDQCNLTLLLMRGKLVFYGPPQEAAAYFGVGRLSEIYDRLAAREPLAWEQQFAGSSLYQEFVEKRLAQASPAIAAARTPPQPAPAGQEVRPPQKPAPVASRPTHLPLWHQFRVLTLRYAELMWGDRRSLRLLLLQAPIVAAFLLLGFVNKPYDQKILAPRYLVPRERAALEQVHTALPEGKAAEILGGLLEAQGPVVPDQLIVNPQYTYMLLFILAVSILWFGCNNSAKEIVKEEAIYGRERSVNLGIFPYLASKFLILSLISAVQTLLMMLVLYGVLELLHITLGQAMPYPDYRLAYPAQYGVLVLLSMTGVALGLLLSACVSSPDRASALLPYVLVPQIILGGGVLTVKEGLLHFIALVASPVYWAYRAIRRGATTLPQDLAVHMDYDDSVWIACAALLVQMTCLLLATTWFLRLKDVRRT